MKRNWIKWIALGLTVGMLGIMVPAVAHAEEATDSVITEEVQEPVTEEEVTPDVPSDDPKLRNLFQKHLLKTMQKVQRMLLC